MGECDVYVFGGHHHRHIKRYCNRKKMRKRKKKSNYVDNELIV